MSTRLNTFVDQSGLVTVSVFAEQAPALSQHFHDLAVDVAEDMIAIGGGAEAVEFPNGALLTASYPNTQLSAWLVSSKDHMVAEPHRLTGYAIGLKIAGMTRDQLLQATRIEIEDSGLGDHPEKSATMPGGFLLVSGAFKAEWTGGGNLATGSFPENSFSWKAQSKDHQVSGPANLRVWAIGLAEQLPVGRLDRFFAQQDSLQSPHPQQTTELPPGFALTGAGAHVHWQPGAGNLLFKIVPTTGTSVQSVTAGSKDHNIPSPATLTVHAIGVRII